MRSRSAMTSSRRAAARLARAAAPELAEVGRAEHQQPERGGQEGGSRDRHCRRDRCQGACDREQRPAPRHLGSVPPRAAPPVPKRRRRRRAVPASRARPAAGSPPRWRRARPAASGPGRATPGPSRCRPVRRRLTPARRTRAAPWPVRTETSWMRMHPRGIHTRFTTSDPPTAEPARGGTRPSRSGRVRPGELHRRDRAEHDGVADEHGRSGCQREAGPTR